MIPDRELAPLFNELLQKLHGVKYMASLDLCQEFLQLPPKTEPGQYTVSVFTIPHTNIREHIMVSQTRYLLLRVR
jgi:hypothetical protein